MSGCCVAIATQQPDVWCRHIPAYTKCDVQYMPVPNVWLLCGYSHTTTRRMVPAYTGIYQMRCTAYKVAPVDGLIQSETCRASNGK